MPFYAVAKGHAPGIYHTWNDAKKQIDRYKHARYKKFDTEREASNFMSQHASASTSGQPTKPAPITKFFETEDPKETGSVLIVFTDGSALNNGAKNCKAGYACVWPEHRELDFSEPIPQGTNNRAEYLAVIKAIETADGVLDTAFEKTLVIYTDSMLLINTITKWMGGWKRNSWRKSDGYPIANPDLVKRLDELMVRRRVSLRHVRAHTGGTDYESRYNDVADRMAKEAAMGRRGDDGGRATRGDRVVGVVVGNCRSSTGYADIAKLLASSTTSSSSL